MRFSSVLSFKTIPFVAIPKLRIRDSLLATFALFLLLYLFTLFNDHSVKNLLAIDFSSQYSTRIGNNTGSAIDQSMVVNRGFCCLTSDGGKDICGRGNCTWPCPDPIPSIPQLDGDQPNSRDGNLAFFIESSGRGVLNVRQACSVESLARQNPNLTVFVLFIDTEIDTNSTVTLQLAKRHKNIHLISPNMDDFLAGTPLEHWYHCTDWRKGPYHVEHLSDALRLLTVAKYGGYYFDLDIIQIRPTTFLRNFFNAASQDVIANGIFHADYGSPVIQMAVKEFARDYNPNAWRHNGPDLIVRVMKKWCNAKDLPSMNSMRCKGFHILPPSAFLPVHYTGMKQFFENRPANETGDPPMVSNEDVIGVHIFNKLNFNLPAYKNSTQYFTRLARSYCPFSFSIAPDVF